MPRAWRPVFSGELATEMLAIVDDIADATANPVERCELVPVEDAAAWQCSLDALAGQSLLQAYRALHGGADQRADIAIALLDQATDGAAALTMSPGLYFGFSGIGWVSAHLAGRVFEETEDNCLEVDQVLVETLDNPQWNARYELLNGVVGIGVYARERWPRPSAARLIDAVVARLDACAERSAAGAAFFNPLETLNPAYRDMAPGGMYNLGMAHGIAGVISLLGSLCRIGAAVERAAPLLAQSVAWLLARELPAGSDHRFRSTYVPDRDLEASRLGWCHGDLAVAAALLVAARGAGESSWEDHARRIARSAAARSIDSTPVTDASLCHGAAGIGHLFNRMYQDTDEPALGEAARIWLRKAVAMRRPGQGLGGYQTFHRGARYDNPGFRVGSSGIALALLAAASPVPPDWDRLLLAS